MTNMPKPTERQYINYLGEFYDDALAIEAAIKNRSKTAEATSLLCSKLQEREVKRTAMVQYLANKRGITFDEMWNLILTGKYEPITGDELAKMQEMDDDA